MTEFSDKALVERRSLEQVLSDLRDKYQRRAGPELAGRIRNVEAEISLREVARKATGGTETTEPTAV